MHKKKITVRILSLSMVALMVFTNFAFAQGKVTKDETVYVNLTHKGKVKDVTVSDWLYSDQKNIEVHDKSILKSIKNVKGDEVPDIKGQKLKWKTNKGEIYYQGKTNKKLPLSVDITYSLNGKKISPEKLGGKSGKFRMTLEVTNNEYHNVVIRGKIKKLYTPFAVATMINFPSDKCRNIKVNTGKVANDGNNSVITYAAMPGLQDSLDIDDEDFDDIFDSPERLEIEADVEDFEMGDVLITATSDSSVLEDIERNDSVIYDAKDGVKDLNDASDDVKAGVEVLNNGLNELSDKFEEFREGIYYLSNATMKLKCGNKELLEGSKELAEGTNDLVDNVDLLKDGTEALLDGSEKLADGAESAYDGASELRGGTSTLSSGISQFKHELGLGLQEKEKKVGPLLEFSKEITLNDMNSIMGLKQNMDELSKNLPIVLQSTITNTAKDPTVVHEVYGAVGKAVEKEMTDLLSSESDLIRTVYKSVYNKRDARKLIGLIKSGMKSVGESAGAAAGAEIGNQLQKKLPDALNQTLTLTNEDIDSMQLTDEEKNRMKKISMQLSSLKSLTNLTDKFCKEVLSNYQVELAELIKQKKQEENKGKTIGMLFAENTMKKTNNSKAELNGALGKLSSGAKALDSGAGKLKKGLKKLSNGSNDLKDGVNDLDDGVVQFKDGANALNNGTNELSDGLEILDDGTLKLSKGIVSLTEATDALNDGIVQLKDGAGELYDGYDEFHEDGIIEVHDKVIKKTDDYDEMFEIRDQLVELSERYSNFAGIGEDMEGKVKFVMKVDNIEAPEAEEVIPEAPEEEKGFIIWLKNIFKKLFKK